MRARDEAEADDEAAVGLVGEAGGVEVAHGPQHLPLAPRLVGREREWVV